MADLLDSRRMATVGQAMAGGSAPANTVAPTIERRDYDVGPGCPQDDLQQRLDDARARLRCNPPQLGAPLRWSI